MKSLLFEILFALQLHRAGVNAEYEFPTGVGGSSVDFRIIAEHEWLIELVSLYESQAIKEATWHREVRDGLTLFGMHLGGSRSDPRQTPEGEMIKAQERIAAKVFNGKRVIKFPVPANAYHLLLVDARGYLGQGGDCSFDWFQMTLGAAAMSEFNLSLVEFWTHPHTQVHSPISGIFEVGNQTKAKICAGADSLYRICQRGKLSRKRNCQKAIALLQSPSPCGVRRRQKSFLLFPIARQMPKWAVVENLRRT